MHNRNQQDKQHKPFSKKPPRRWGPNPEKLIQIEAVPAPTGGYLLQTHGMANSGKFELELHVAEAWALPAGANLINDTASFVLTRRSRILSGQRVQVGEWSVLEFKVDISRKVISLLDSALPAEAEILLPTSTKNTQS